MKRVMMTLDSSSIREVISMLSDLVSAQKLGELRERIAEEIKDEAAEGFANAGVDIDGRTGSPLETGGVDVVCNHTPNASEVEARGENAVWIEFGAGVTYNGGVGTYANPLADTTPGIVPIGTYGSGNGAKRAWGFKENGELYITRGTPAAMPMYHAEMNVLDRLDDIAEEVFR